MQYGRTRRELDCARLGGASARTEHREPSHDRRSLLASIAAVALALLLIPTPSIAASPSLTIESALEPATAIEREALATWRELEARWNEAASQPPPPPRFPIRLRRSTELPTGKAGRTRPGIVHLRQDRAQTLDEKLLLAMRHELAHQFLWSACPAASDDALFHEAFAIATSGEIDLWSQGEYLSLPRARRTLEKAPSLDTPSARRAIARLLVESTEPGATIPKPLADRIRDCATGVRWQEPMSAAELAGAPQRAGDAVVVVSRRSGDTLFAEGDCRVPMPYGSTLKPFLHAAARGRAPELKPRGVAEWVCGELPAQMDLRTALLRSCNGYFIDWAAKDPSIASLGEYGPVLAKLGLGRAPADITEAIGLRPTLKLSPLALAQAYRLLAERSEETFRVLKDNVREGTLSGLEASKLLEGFATKTGTVRDSASHPQIGWIVAVGDDVVAVMVRAGKQPRDFAGELAKALARVGTRRHSTALEAHAVSEGPGRGGEPWKETRAEAEVERLLGEGAFSLRFAGRKVTYLRPMSGRGASHEEQVTIACEPFRLELKLPSCPMAASQAEGEYVFEGRGREPGERPDVESAPQGEAQQVGD
ncbi:MAG: hypothetical protein ACOX6T_05565 [Myxococcales bacterium]